MSVTPEHSGRHRASPAPTRRRLAVAVVGTVAAAASAIGGVAALSAVTRTAETDGPVALGSPSQPTSPLAAAATPDAAPAATTDATASPSASVPQLVGDCSRPAGASPEVTVTEVDLGVQVTGYGRESDTEPLPMAIAALPDGGSWLAWLGTDNRVYLGKLDCEDQLVGTPTSFEGIDLQDVHADSDGGVLLLTRPGTCGNGPLCGGNSSPCNTMHTIRFDSSGNQVWERQVTNLTSDRTGYDDGARFVWWYQHHGRLASSGDDYAAYFGVAITVQNGNCIDIHQGDRMQVVSTDGSLVSGHRDSFEVGCSHSWTTRIVWDHRVGEYVMVCATDNRCRIALAAVTAPCSAAISCWPRAAAIGPPGARAARCAWSTSPTARPS
jgi:hypothetical protein